jgi:hypothetical protein
MKYQVQHTLGSVIHEGTRHECELILKAFNTYGVGEHKLDLVKVTEKHRFSDQTREEIITYLIDAFQEGMFGDGMERDYVEHGMDFVGVTNMTDAELMSELEQIFGDDSEEELVVRAQAELAIDRMLTE